MDSGSAVQRIDLEPRVVGQRPLPRVARDHDRLLPRVLGEVRAVLNDVRKIGDLADHKRKVGVNLADFADLALVF